MEDHTLAASNLALGNIVAGALLGAGFKTGRAVDRFVTVKGVPEREVEADLVLRRERIKKAASTRAPSRVQP